MSLLIEPAGPDPAALPLTLYVHFPWCVSKCPYCDFNSHRLEGELPAPRYIDALLTDLAGMAQTVRGRALQAVFFGGGTPSLFPPDELGRLLAGVGEHCNVVPDAEVTMEANPGTLEHADFGAYRQAGINRLSLGVQSFDPVKLSAIGRIHSGEDALLAFAQARAAGFDNINLDLMYALPGQSCDEATADVRAAIDMAPEHVSLYHLTLEPNTVFYARRPRLPPEDDVWAMQAAAAALLESAGYLNYEVSAWSRAGAQCAHNLNYWRFGDYLALGAGAHSKQTLADGTIRRGERAAHPRGYLRAVEAAEPVFRSHTLDPADRIFEFMLNNLRLSEGFGLTQFEVRTGLSASVLEPGLEVACERGLLEAAGPLNYRPTELGWRFLDDLQAIFLPEPAD